MVNQLTSFFNRVGREGFYGLDAGFDTPDTAADALGMDSATPDANESIARYLGIGGTSSKDMVTGFGSWVGASFGRQFQLFGQNPMQQPGMNLAIAAQPVGVSVFVGAPRFNPVHVAGSEHGEMPTQPSRSNINVTANVGGKDAAKADGAKDADEVIDPDAEAAARTEALNKAVEAEKEKKPDRFEPADWERIVADAKSAAEARAEKNGTKPDAEFRHIIREARSLSSGENADQAQFVRRLGEWRAKYIGGIDDSEQVSRVVDDVAGADEKSFTLKHVVPKTWKDKQLEKQGVRKFKVEGDSKEHGLRDGETIYYVTMTDKETGKVKSWWTRDSRNADGLIKSLGADGKKDEIKVGGGSDWVGVTPETLVSGRTTEEGHEQVLTRYKTGESSGETSSGLRQANAYLYRDGAGNWYRKDGDGFEELVGEPTLVAGRLYFNEAGVKADAKRADRIGNFFDDVDSASKAMVARRDAADAKEKEIAAERVARVEQAFDEALGEEAADKISFVYNNDDGSITVSCTAENSGPAIEAMKKGDDQDARMALLNGILLDLPADAPMFLNDMDNELVLGDPPLQGLVNALKGQEYRVVTVAGGSAIDLSGDGMDDEAIVAELAQRVEAAKENSETGNISEIVISDEVIFPESFGTDSAGGERILDTDRVRDIAFALSERFGHVPVSFSRATRNGDPEGLHFVTGLTKAEVDARKTEVAAAEAEAARAAEISVLVERIEAANDKVRDSIWFLDSHLDANQAGVSAGRPEGENLLAAVRAHSDGCDQCTKFLVDLRAFPGVFNSWKADVEALIRVAGKDDDRVQQELNKLRAVAYQFNTNVSERLKKPVTDFQPRPEEAAPARSAAPAPAAPRPETPATQAPLPPLTGPAFQNSSAEEVAQAPSGGRLL